MSNDRTRKLQPILPVITSNITRTCQPTRKLGLMSNPIMSRDDAEPRQTKLSLFFIRTKARVHSVFKIPTDYIIRSAPKNAKRSISSPI